MPMLCVTCDQIDDWFKTFREKKCPDDLVVVDSPRLYLSCRLGDLMASKAWACYGYDLAEEINNSEDVYRVAEDNCTSHDVEP